MISDETAIMAAGITEITAMTAKTMGGITVMAVLASPTVSTAESNLIRKEEGEIRRKPNAGRSGNRKDEKNRKPKDPAALEKRLDAQMNKYWDRDGLLIRRDQRKAT